MPVEVKMPALSPTMEEGTLARWLVKEGDAVSSGDLIAEIETDKATMEFEAVDEGVIARIVVPEGSEGVKVGAVIAVIAEEGEDVGDDVGKEAGGEKGEQADAGSARPAAGKPASGKETPPAKEQESPARAKAAPAPAPTPAPASAPVSASSGERVKASPLARRIAADKGVDLAALTGSGPGGRIVRADVDAARDAPPRAAAAQSAPTPAPAAAAPVSTDIPHSTEKLSGMRKTIARRLTEAKQTIPHIYLTVDVQLDKLLKLRADLNDSLEPQGIRLSVNDLLIKALAKSLLLVPECNVSFAGDQLVRYERADISVAVSLPAGLITPIIADAGSKAISAISVEMKALAERARAGKLQPHEYQGGTASLSNMGMYGIRQFDAVINPPQAMIMAVGAGEKRPFVIDDALQIATVMSATGSFDHRAIDGADGARQMQAFRELIERPLALLA